MAVMATAMAKVVALLLVVVMTMVGSVCADIKSRRGLRWSKVEREDAGELQGSGAKYAYFGYNGRWPKSHSNLTYALSLTDVTTLVSREDILFALDCAFRTWAAIVPLTFTHLDDRFWEWADIKVSFLGGDHGDGQPFDGTLGVLGHSFAPEDGRMHLDLAEQWSVDVLSQTSLSVPATMDLQSVMLHEVGHLIGLGHSMDPASAMFADIAPHQVKHSLSADDIQGAQSLYGASTGYQLLQGILTPPSSSSPPDISPFAAHTLYASLSLPFLLLLSFS